MSLGSVSPLSNGCPEISESPRALGALKALGTLGEMEALGALRGV